MRLCLFTSVLFTLDSIIVGGMEPPLDCCLKLSKTRVRAEDIVSYTQQFPSGMCPVRAVRFKTKKGNMICSDPHSNWAKWVKEHTYQSERVDSLEFPIITFRKMSRRHPDQIPEPAQLALLDIEKQRFHTESLPDVRTPNPVSNEQEPEVFKLLHLRQDLTSNLERALHPFPTENHGLGLGGADPHPYHFTLGCKLVQQELEGRIRIVPPGSEVQLSVGLSSPCHHIDLTGEAVECDPPIVGTHPLIPLLKQGNHHPSLPVQRYCPQCPHYVAKMCQLGQPHNTQSLAEPRKFSYYLSHLSPSDRRALPGISKLYFLCGFRSGAVCLFQCISTNYGQSPFPNPKAQGNYPLIHWEHQDVMGPNQLITFLFAMHSLSESTAGMGPPVDCCLKISKTRVRAEDIVNYTQQFPSGLCPVRAVRFKTKKGNVICSDPHSNWAKWVKEHVNQRDRTTVKTTTRKTWTSPGGLTTVNQAMPLVTSAPGPLTTSDTTTSPTMTLNVPKESTSTTYMMSKLTTPNWTKTSVSSTPVPLTSSSSATTSALTQRIKAEERGTKKETPSTLYTLPQWTTNSVTTQRGPITSLTSTRPPTQSESSTSATTSIHTSVTSEPTQESPHTVEPPDWKKTTSQVTLTDASSSVTRRIIKSTVITGIKKHNPGSGPKLPWTIHRLKKKKKTGLRKAQRKLRG
ncbi:uncharacterized protein xcl32a.1 [Hoplias malabaricus]|uniref:uncharacterized protein xcl32a.1 n=1 Tax=Hoplias malabaricus TaxID=27720 RepID=UPI00346235CA